MSEGALIVGRELTKAYEAGRVRALRGVTLSVLRGEALCVMGPSGCGKSTLLHILGGMDRPTSGEIFFDGQALDRIADLARFRCERVGFVFQSFNLLPTLSAVENVEIPMLETRRSSSERRRRALDLLDRVGLSGFAHRIPSDLSGGERQRVAIARSLANDPEAIFADEPTGNLDSSFAATVLDLLGEINRRQGTTVVIVTHDDRVPRVADRTLHMLDGQIVSEPGLPRGAAQ
jgi:putative ABC transport system ATP-binding protein